MEETTTVKTLAEVGEGSEPVFEVYREMPLSEFPKDFAEMVLPLVEVAGQGALYHIADWNAGRLKKINKKYELGIIIPPQKKLDEMKKEGPFLIRPIVGKSTK